MRGLELGADDYLPKTFSTRELLARLRAVTRRARGGLKKDEVEAELVVGQLRINTGARTAVMGDQALVLTPVEYDLLLALARSRGRVKSREGLIEDIRDRHYDVFDRSIDVHISRIRAAIEDDPKKPRRILTLRGTGYVFAKDQDR